MSLPSIRLAPSDLRSGHTAELNTFKQVQVAVDGKQLDIVRTNRGAESVKVVLAPGKHTVIWSWTPTGSTYTYSEAARYAGVSSTTVRRWIYGHESHEGQMRPVIGLQDRRETQTAVVSLLQLAEIVVVARFRRPQF